MVFADYFCIKRDVFEADGANPIPATSLEQVVISVAWIASIMDGIISKIDKSQIENEL